MTSSLMHNSQISEVILTSASDIETSSDDPQTELDSHAIVVILVSNSFLFKSIGRTCNVRPFSIDLGMAKGFPIADGALACDCPFTGEVCILVVRISLRVPYVDHDLILPFTMRASDVTINEVLKIYCEDPIVSDYRIYFEHSDMWIPFS